MLYKSTPALEVQTVAF